MSQICKIEDCGKEVYALGLCPKHYTRQRRHGHALGGGPDYGQAQAFLTAHKDHTADACLLWPFAKDSKGYGVVWFRDRQTTANFAMCTLAHGEPPTPLHESAHSCGNGHNGCINPKHLRWDTRAGNHADKVEHDTHSRGVRTPTHILVDADVFAIRAARGVTSQTVLATKYGVHKATISAVQRRKIWAWLPEQAA